MPTDALVVLEPCLGPYVVLKEPHRGIPAGWLMHECDYCILFPCPLWIRAWSDARATQRPPARARAGAAAACRPRGPCRPRPIRPAMLAK